MEQTTTTSKIPTCIGLPPDLRDRMDAAAAALERPRSWIAATAIREYLAKLDAAQRGDAP
jgi:predicted transcriptional regulator